MVLVCDTRRRIARLTINFSRSTGGLPPEQWTYSKYPIFKSFIIVFCHMYGARIEIMKATCRSVKTVFLEVKDR